jgi:hypothetical protein
VTQIASLIQTLAKGGPVMDAARGAGIGKLAIAVTPRESLR